MTVLDVISLGILITTALSLGQMARGVLTLRVLAEVAPLPDAQAPRVSVIVSALNEAQTLEPALASLLAMDYPQLEVLAINDRSSDETPQIIERIAQTDARLRAVHVAKLPAGWLGKNHALAIGAAQARGDYLLFTDADVVFAPDCLRRAVNLCEQERLDHLAVAPDMPVRDALLGMLLASFSLGMLAVYQPWKVRHSTRHSIGLGAFNLVRREAYERSGGHAAIPMAVLDDLALGQWLKQHGAVQDLAIGRGLLSVAWYRSAREMAQGLQKNLFAALDYRVSRLLGATVAIALFGIAPWLGLAVPGFPRACCAVSLALLLVCQGAQLQIAGWPLRGLLYLPLVPWLSLLTMWRASLTTLRRGGIVWRGSFYPLDALRRQHRPRSGGR